MPGADTPDTFRETGDRRLLSTPLPPRQGRVGLFYPSSPVHRPDSGPESLVRASSRLQVQSSGHGWHMQYLTTRKDGKMERMTTHEEESLAAARAGWMATFRLMWARLRAWAR